jgi:hypothetical protein
MTLKQALNNVADEFSVGKIDTRQLKLSIQTHIRAMMRRLCEQGSFLANIGGVDHFILIPPTRKSDVEVKPIPPESFDIISAKEFSSTRKSLGEHPGDRLIPIPIPNSKFKLYKEASENWKKRHHV